jgi:hypothetical protein
MKNFNDCKYDYSKIKDIDFLDCGGLSSFIYKNEYNEFECKNYQVKDCGNPTRASLYFEKNPDASYFGNLYDDAKKIPMLCPCEIDEIKESIACYIDNIPPMFNFNICMRCIAIYWKTKICNLFE